LRYTYTTIRAPFWKNLFWFLIERLGAVLIMAPNFLVLARKAIGEALDLTSGKDEQLLKLNKLQCKCVAQKLSETREILKYVESAAGSANPLERREATLGKELYRVVTDALLLIKECRGEQWLRAAIRQRSEKISEDFVEICYEVQWCTSVLCICLQSAVRKQAAVVEPEACDGRLSVLDHFKLEAAANQDREDLRSNLELLKQGHVCDASCASSKAEKCLAAQFFKKLIVGRLNWQLIRVVRLQKYCLPYCGRWIIEIFLI
jgi:hypothetical protein